MSEDLSKINPIKDAISSIAPTSEYVINIARELYINKIIIVSPDTDPNSVIIENDSIKQFYIDLVSWHINIKSNILSADEVLNELLYPTCCNITSEEACNLWQEVAFYEVLENLHYQLIEYRLPKDGLGDKTFAAIRMGLEYYSVSQMYNIVWGTVKNAAAFSQKNGISRQHAVNTIANSITKRIEKSLAEDWETKGFERNYNYPQTAISSLLHDKILQIGELGFKLKPTMHTLEKYMRSRT